MVNVQCTKGLLKGRNKTNRIRTDYKHCTIATKTLCKL